MKFNDTHALIGLAVLVIGVKLVGASKAKANTDKPAAGPINAAPQWWSYAGSWNVPGP